MPSSIVARTGFTLADMVSPGCSRIRVPQRYCTLSLSQRIIDAMLVESRQRDVDLGCIILDLADDLSCNYMHSNGPIADMLGFTLMDLVGRNEHYVQLPGMPGQYAMSARLYEALRFASIKVNTRRPAIFRQLQEELLSTAATALRHTPGIIKP